MKEQLCFEENFIEYLKKLRVVLEQDDVTVIMAARDTIGHHVGQDGYRELSTLGITCLDFENGKNNHWKGFVVIFSGNQMVYEKLADINKSVNISIEIKENKYDVFSSPLNSSNATSILVNNEEYAMNTRGLNIVVFDNVENRVIDSVSFDTHSINRKCMRNDYKTKRFFYPKIKNDLLIKNIDDVKGNLAIDKIIGEDSNISALINITFFFWGFYSLWNTVDSLVEAFLNDGRYNVTVVVQSDDYRTNRYIESVCNANIVNIKDYSINGESPDIAIYNNVNAFFVDSTDIKFKICVYGALLGGDQTNFSPQKLRDVIIKDKTVDGIVVAPHIYDLVNTIESYDGNTFFKFGNPKLDDIFIGLQNRKEKRDNPQWSKTTGRTCILWAFDHNWNLSSVTFDLYIKSFIDFMQENDEYCLIIRPHPNYPMELLQKGIWSKNDIFRLKRFFKESSNIIWDETPDYREAYSFANAVITDINCGITVSALALGVEIINVLYEINNIDELNDFLKSVGRGEDQKRKMRENIAKKYLGDFDGKNGERIKLFIENEYCKKVQSLENTEHSKKTENVFS